MGDMVDAYPPAKQWVLDALQSARRDRRFARVRSAIIWNETKLPDGEVCGGEDGEAVARRFGRGVLVFRDDHAGLHPAGWLKDAAYFAPPDAPAFVVAIIGFYDGERAGTLSDASESDFTPPTYRPPTDAELARGLVTVAAHHREVDEDWLRQEVQAAPLGVTKQIDWEYRHSEEVIQILTLVVNATLLGLAGSTNARVKSLFDWCFGRLADGFLAATQQDTHFIVETTFLDCTVRFHVPTRSPAIVGKARDGLPDAVNRAQALVRSMARDGVSLREVKYRFDPVERTWAPWFAAADDGTLYRHPGLLVSHEGLPDGLSLAGRYEEAPEFGPDARLSER